MTYVYKMFQSGVDLAAYMNKANDGSALDQASIVSVGFDPGNGRYFIIHTVSA